MREWLVLVTVLALGATTACSSKSAAGPAAMERPAGTEVATFAGGCFWCMEEPLEKLDGVLSVVSGFTGGRGKNPSYHQVTSGLTGHTEAVQVTYDPSRVNYEQLLDVYWSNIDPTDAEGQFVDRGKQYEPAIYYHTGKQKALAAASKRDLQRSKRFSKPIVIPILKAQPFYPAEDVHQDYYRKNAQRYKMYKRGSGRETFLEKYWKSDSQPSQVNGQQ